MAHLNSANDLAKHLKTEQVPATEVREGDILIGQGRVVLVSKIDKLEWGPATHHFVEFDSEPVPGDHDGYLQAISLRKTDMATIVARESVQ